MLSAEHTLFRRERLAVHRLRLVPPALALEHRGQVVAGDHRRVAIGAELRFENGQGTPKQLLRLVVVPHAVKDRGKRRLVGGKRWILLDGGMLSPQLDRAPGIWLRLLEVPAGGLQSTEIVVERRRD